MNEEMEKELDELSEEIAIRKKAIIDEWKKRNKPPYGYGIIEPEKQKALMEENRIRAGAIIKKYKQTK